MHEKTIICLNGTYVPSDQALIHVSDRGFRFGDGVFETIRLVNGTPYQWPLHLERLAQGLTALRIAMPTVDWKSASQELIQRNRATNGFLRIAISRGMGSRGYLPDASTPTWVMEYLPPTPMPEKPFRLCLSQWRRAPLHVLPANAKLEQGANSTLALLEAHENNCDEALQLTTDAHLCETASANLFWIKGNTLYTPALTTGCVAGTTRNAVMRLSPLPWNEVHASINALQEADAIFITNARLGVWPIAEIQPLQIHFNIHPVIAELQQRLTNDYQFSTWTTS